MADTFTPVSGFLAGIYRSLGAVIGATEKHQLLLNPDFETGDLTSWTDDSAGGASTAVATALKGWKERSWGVVLDDDGSNLAGIHQDVTLATAITAAQALTHRIIASCWARFDAVDDTATLKVTGTLNTGAWLLWKQFLQQPGQDMLSMKFLPSQQDLAMRPLR